MSIKELSIQELAIWANKIESHIVDLQSILKTVHATKSINQYFDKDNSKSKKVVSKLEEMSDKLNEIYSEIDTRSKKQLGLDFEVEFFTELLKEVDGAYLKRKAILEKEASKNQEKQPIKLKRK